MVKAGRWRRALLQRCHSARRINRRRLHGQTTSPARAASTY
jgi:hypothetical protein